MMSKQSKREGPAPVPPVTVGTVRYEVPHDAAEVGGTQSGGYIAAVDAASGERLWALRVYETAYDPQRERDVQDVFITRLAHRGGGQLDVEDEEGRRWIVDTAARKSRPA